jgi:hypothetical protein
VNSPAHDIFQSLSSARWRTAGRTFGSSHSTLIGLFVDWWINCDPDRNTALDGPPSHGSGNAGQGDAVLCASDIPAGVLEVEGTQPLDKVRSIGNYFSTPRDELRSIWFGILLLYSYAPTGRGKDRHYPSAEIPTVVEAAKQVTREQSTKSIIIVTLDKQFSRIPCGVRSLSDYYSGTTNKIAGVLLQDGTETDRRVYFG